MNEPLAERIRRVHHALGQSVRDDISSIRGQHLTEGDRFLFRVDFSQGRTKEDLDTVAFNLIHSIASIKDHLKNWCRANGQEFRGEALVDTNRDVALVHDLWNLDKHGNLNRPPRSGCKPQLKDLAQALETRGTSEDVSPDSSVSITYDLSTGALTQVSSDGGIAELVVNGTVQDEHGTDLGQLQSICRKALKAWEAELASLGLEVPTRVA